MELQYSITTHISKLSLLYYTLHWTGIINILTLLNTTYCKFDCKWPQQWSVISFLSRCYPCTRFWHGLPLSPSLNWSPRSRSPSRNCRIKARTHDINPPQLVGHGGGSPYKRGQLSRPARDTCTSNEAKPPPPPPSRFWLLFSKCAGACNQRSLTTGCVFDAHVCELWLFCTSVENLHKLCIWVALNAVVSKRVKRRSGDIGLEVL